MDKDVYNYLFSLFNQSSKKIKQKTKKHLKNKCFLCGKNEIIDSHTIPKKNLNLITDTNKNLIKFGYDDFNCRDLQPLIYSYDIPDEFLKFNYDKKFNYLKNSNFNFSKNAISYKETQIFNLICNECDNKIFKNYEVNNFEINSDTNDVKIILNEIFKKNIFYICSNGINEYEYLKQVFYDELEMDCEKDFVKKQTSISEMLNYINFYKEIKDFSIFYYKKLDYKVQFAALYTIDAKLFEKFLNIKINLKNRFAINILPQEDSTIILCFGKSNLCNVINTDFNNLNDEEKQDFIIKCLIYDGVLFCNPQYARNLYTNVKDLYINRILRKLYNVDEKFFIDEFKKYKNYDYLLSKDFNE